MTWSLNIFPFTDEKIQSIPLAGVLLEYFEYSQVLGMLFLPYCYWGLSGKKDECLLKLFCRQKCILIFINYVDSISFTVSESPLPPFKNYLKNESLGFGYYTCYMYIQSSLLWMHSSQMNLGHIFNQICLKRLWSVERVKNKIWQIADGKTTL